MFTVKWRKPTDSKLFFVDTTFDVDADGTLLSRPSPRAALAPVVVERQEGSPFAEFPQMFAFVRAEAPVEPPRAKPKPPAQPDVPATDTILGKP
jgi:hypothetical protein